MTDFRDAEVPRIPSAYPLPPYRRPSLARRAWHVLVGIKDALVLVAMLLFFGVLSAVLLARPGKGPVGDGALLLKLDGAIVEQPSEPTTFAFASGQAAAHEFRLRDLVRAIDKARGDASVKAVVLDLDKFGGAYPAALDEIGAALARVRASGKPVLAYATAYTDGSYRLAANASEIWVDPMGGTLFTGPGGSQPYYKGLIDKLGVTAHVYRVGKYKSFVEPYTRTEASPEAKEEVVALYRVLFDGWQQAIHRARPKAQVAGFLTAPDKVIQATGGDIAQADLRAGLVDHLGDRLAFGQRVAQFAASEGKKAAAGSFKTISYQDYVDINPLPRGGDGVGVVTVAGDIVDGKAGPGSAGGDTIANAILDGLATKHLKALVLRVDSPGGSALASERIRQALLQAKRAGLPVVVSMGSVAASGGYWVSTAGDMIFAEPNTITGSIGIFGIIPTFENALKKIGVTSDGVRTTPLSGQPDILAGTTPAADAVFQAGIEHGYREFINRVAQARHLTPARVNEIGQGRVWDGGTARRIGLVDKFGTLDDAIKEAARRAGLKTDGVHAEYLERKPSSLARLVQQFSRSKDDDDNAGDDVFARAGVVQRATLARALGDARRLATGASIQARCLECAGLGPSVASPDDTKLMDLLLARLGW